MYEDLTSADDALRYFQEKILNRRPEEEILEYVFNVLSVFIPFDRVGIAIQEGDWLRSKWVKSRLPVEHLRAGYTAKISGSSLQDVLNAQRPRVISDLELYLHQHPASESTALILKDGMRSSLTFPLLMQNNSFGVVFFSSTRPNAYTLEHMDFLGSVAKGLSLVIERTELMRTKTESKNQDLRLAKVLHDLRSPLSVMMSFTDLIEDSTEFAALDDSTKNLFNIIRQNENFLWSLINDLTDLSAIKANQLVVKQTNVKISGFISEAMEILRPICSKKGIVLKFNIDDNCPEIWHMDPLKIRQVLENLVTNAAKFSAPRTAVTLSVWENDGHLYMSVRDQGMGIPEEDIPKLFHEFGVARVRPTGGESSTGLGLAICREIVNAHGGQISVRSRINEGSCFEFWLPQA